MSRQYMKDRWCVRCGRTTPTPYTLKTILWRRKAGLPTGSVLDLGCGNGRNLRAFQISGGATRLVGFDLCTERANSVCTAHICREVNLVEGILGQTEPPSGKFDVVLLNYSLMFLTPRERKVVARQVKARVAKKGWVVIEMYPAKDSNCATDELCRRAMFDFAFDTGLCSSAEYGLAGVVRSSKGRMILEKR